MLKKISSALLKPLLTLCLLTIVHTLFAQTPQAVGTVERTALRRTPLACSDQFAGTTVRTLGVGAKTNDIRFLCLGDSMLIRHNGNANLTNDPTPATPAGIGYTFYNCPPTVAGPTDWATVKRAPCTTRQPQIVNGNPIYAQDSVWLAASNINGNINFVNAGVLQTRFNNGAPIKFFFAPMTIDNFAPRTQESNASCVHVNIADTFSVVYLNAIRAVNATYTGALSGAFQVTGGLPQYNSSNYSITIQLSSNPAIVGTITSGVATQGGTVTYNVPQAGTYNILVFDGKSCDYTFQANFPTVQFNASLERVAMTGDTACVRVSALRFTNISSMQFDVVFDPAVVQFVSLRNVTLTPSNNAVVSNTQPGILSFSWNANAVNQAITRPDGQTLFELCFRAIGATGRATSIRFSDTLTPTDIYNNIPTQIGAMFQSGSIIIGGVPLSLILRADSVRCNAQNNGRFTIRTQGGTAPFTFNWRNSTIAALNGVGSINTSADSAIISNLPAGIYQVTVTATGGETQSGTVEIRQAPSLFINPPTAVNPRCFGDSTGSLTLVNYGGGVAPYTFRWSNNATTTAITGLPQGNYRVTMTDAQGCRDSSSGSIGVNPISVSNRQSVDATCNGISTGSATILSLTGGTTTGGVYGFAWTTGSTNRGTSSAVTTLAPGRYYVSITDNNNCVLRDSFTIGALRTLVAANTIQNITCAGQRNGVVSVTASALGSSATPYTFTWTANAPTPTNTIATTRITGLSGGTYGLTIRDRDGCRLDSNFIVREPDSIRIDTFNVRNESCSVGNDGQISVRVTGGTVPYRYRWSRTPATDTFPTITNLPAGVYTVTVTDSAGCSATRRVTLTAPASPTVDSFVVIKPNCHNTTDGQVTVFARAGGANITAYTWSNGGTSSSISGLTGGTYYVTISQADGCRKVDSVRVIAPDTLRIDTTLTQFHNPNCPGQPTGDIILVMRGGTPRYTFAWSGGPTTQGSVFASLLAGTYTFTITDSKGCTANANFTLVDPPKIRVAFTNPVNVTCYGRCNPGDGGMTARASGGTANTGRYSFTWSSGEAASNTDSSRAVRLCQGLQYVSVEDNNCGIVDSVIVGAPDSFAFQSPIITQPTCKGLTDGGAQVRVTGGTLPYTYNWTTGANTNYIVNVAAGRYSVVITDARLCTYQLSVRVNEPDSFKLILVDTLSDQITCFGRNDGQLGVVRRGGNGGGTQYSWTPAVSFTNIAPNLSSGAYTVVARDDKGCRDSISTFLTQPDPITIQMPRPQAPRCSGDPTFITVDTAYGSTYLYPFTFSVDNGASAPVGGSVPIFAGQHLITIIETTRGCTLDTTIYVAEPPAIRIDFDSIANNPGSTKINIGLGDSLRLNPNVYTDSIGVRVVIDSVRWTPLTFLRFDGQPLRPIVKPLDDVTYTLTVYDLNGCSATESVLVEVDRYRNVYVPTVFSPNGDGRNDVFRISSGAGITKINYMRLFDRWGNLVYNRENIAPDDQTAGWDGTYGGKTMDNGVFVYLIQVTFEDNVTLIYRGDVTLIR